jgi:hypothetical protein
MQYKIQDLKDKLNNMKFVISHSDNGKNPLIDINDSYS